MNKEEQIELRSEEFQEVLGSVPPWILRWGIIILGSVIAILLIGSAVIKYPDIIPSNIVLTGSTPPAAITARTSGKLNELLVDDNQQVNVGDYLAVIDNPAHTKDIKDLKDYLKRWNMDSDTLSCLPEKTLQVGSLQTLYTDFYVTLFEYMEYRRRLYYPQKLDMTRRRISQYEAQYDNLLRQQQIITEQLQLSHKQYQRDSILNVKNVLSSEDREKSKNQYLQNRLSDENMHSSLQNMQIQIAQLKESLLDTDYQGEEQYNTLHSRILSLGSRLLTEIQSWELTYVLKAPIAGKVTFTNYWTTNQNVITGEEVFTIIPYSNGIIGKARLPIARSGKVQIGQKVNIRIENFPENEFGILRGTVRNISLVPAQTGDMIYYTVEISLPKNLTTTYKKELPWLPNMQGQADIIIEDISLLERFFLPIKKILKESINM